MHENDDDNAPNCSSCKFYIRHKYHNLDVIADYGECRRFPPRRLAETMSAFPIVTDEIWCGEWQS